MKSFTAKKKQHYVPQFYLKKWMTHEGLWVKNKSEGSEKIYLKKTTIDVAEENYFYGIEMDDVVLDMLISRFRNDASSNNVVKKLMDDFLLIKLFDDVIEKRIGVVNHDIKLMKSAKEILDYIKKSHIENAHSKIEDVISKQIEQFNKEQSSDFWIPPSTEAYRSLMILFGFQLMRTKGFMSRLESDISQMCLKRDEEEIILSDKQKNSVLKCLLYIESHKFCMHKETLGCHMIIHRNRTKLSYLTSDCPAIYIDRKQRPSFSYSLGIMPLTPKLLIEFRFSERNDKTIAEIKDIYSLHQIHVANKMIQRYSLRFVFARKKRDFNIGDENSSK